MASSPKIHPERLRQLAAPLRRSEAKFSVVRRTFAAIATIIGFHAPAFAADDGFSSRQDSKTPAQVNKILLASVDHNASAFEMKAASKSPEELLEDLETRTFRIPVTSDWVLKYGTDEGEAYLENPSGDVWQILSTGEQLFTPEAAARETVKAGVRVPSGAEWDAIVQTAKAKIAHQGRQSPYDGRLLKTLGLGLNGVISPSMVPTKRNSIGVYFAGMRADGLYHTVTVSSNDEAHVSAHLRSPRDRKTGYSVLCFKRGS
jgi:hypothetical protein